MPFLRERSPGSSTSRALTASDSQRSRLQVGSEGTGLANFSVTRDATEVQRALSGTKDSRNAGAAGIFANCSNPNCSTGWLHLWRSRSAPIFEGGWSCSASCTAARLEAAIRRELEGRLGEASTHRHRIPLGLVMLEQGWITSEQLRQALETQREAGQGKLGGWLVHQYGVSEQLVTRALSLQWSCPVLPLEYHDPEAMAVVMPRLFVEAFGALPIRVAGGQILYLGFEERLDPVVTLAVERMLGLRVESGLVRASRFYEAHERMLSSTYPQILLVETFSESPLTRVLVKAVERAKPVEARLVRVHDCLWLRMWLERQSGPLPAKGSIEDVICSLAAS